LKEKLKRIEIFNIVCCFVGVMMILLFNNGVNGFVEGNFNFVDVSKSLFVLGIVITLIS
jgi:drug/metabolite transporter (DMT)-like permease